MKIIVNEKNIEKLEKEIAKAEGRATARTITASDIKDSIKSVEKKLSTILKVSDWKGLKFDIDVNAQPFPSAYKYQPESTQFRIERFTSGWGVIAISRDNCGQSYSREITPLNIATKSEEIAGFLQEGKNWDL